MGKFYGLKTLAGEKTLEEIPKLWKTVTEKWLNENQEL